MGTGLQSIETLIVHGNAMMTAGSLVHAKFSVQHDNIMGFRAPLCIVTTSYSNSLSSRTHPPSVPCLRTASPAPPPSPDVLSPVEVPVFPAAGARETRTHACTHGMVLGAQ